MKPKKRYQPSELILRCLAIKRGGYWVAMCLDLDLVAQADTLPQVKKALFEQMQSYITDALGVHSEHAYELLNRKAPLRYFALYYALKVSHFTRRKLSFEAPIPMIPAHA